MCGLGTVLMFPVKVVLKLGKITLSVLECIIPCV